MPPRGTRTRALYGGPTFSLANAVVEAAPRPTRRTSIPTAENPSRVPFGSSTVTLQRTVMKLPGLALFGSGRSRCACGASFDAAGPATASATTNAHMRRFTMPVVHRRLRQGSNLSSARIAERLFVVVDSLGHDDVSSAQTEEVKQLITDMEPAAPPTG
jgi:hypothetical protein